VLTKLARLRIEQRIGWMCKDAVLPACPCTNSTQSIGSPAGQNQITPGPA